MPHLTLEIGADGPMVDCLVGVSRARARILQAQRQPVPPPATIRGLIDTGATRTCIESQVLKSLNLMAVDQVSIFTSSTGDTPHVCGLFEASLTFLHPKSEFRIASLPVIEAHLSGIQALIGRDVLEQCLLVYDGQSGHFSLAF